MKPDNITEGHQDTVQRKSVYSPKRIFYSLVALALLAFSFAFYISDGFGLRVVPPQNNPAGYNPVEARGIITYIKQAETQDQCMRITEKYHILNEEGASRISFDQDLHNLKSQLIDIVTARVPDGPKVTAIVKPQEE